VRKILLLALSAFMAASAAFAAPSFQQQDESVSLHDLASNEAKSVVSSQSVTYVTADGVSLERGVMAYVPTLSWGMTVGDAKRSERELLAECGGKPYDGTKHLNSRRYRQGSVAKRLNTGGIWVPGHGFVLKMETLLPGASKTKMVVCSFVAGQAVDGKRVGHHEWVTVSADGLNLEVTSADVVDVSNIDRCFNGAEGLVYLIEKRVAPLVLKTKERTIRGKTEFIHDTEEITAPAAAPQCIYLPSLAACCASALQVSPTTAYQSNLMYIGVNIQGGHVGVGPGGTVNCNPITGIVQQNPIYGPNNPLTPVNNPEHINSGTAGNPIVGQIGGTSGHGGVGTYNQPDLNKNKPKKTGGN